MSSLNIYSWVAVAASFWMLHSIPTKLNTVDNLFGTAICAVFGVFLWPIYLVAFIKSKKAKNQTHQGEPA
jgi:hypothetical protein